MKKIIFVIFILFNLNCFSGGWQLIYNAGGYGINNLNIQFTANIAQPRIFLQSGCFGYGSPYPGGGCGIYSGSNIYYRIKLDTISYIPYNNFIKSRYCFWAAGSHYVCSCVPLNFFTVSSLDSNFLIKYYRYTCGLPPGYTIEKTYISYNSGNDSTEYFNGLSLNGCVINPINDSIICLAANETVYRSTNKGISWTAAGNYPELKRIINGGYFYQNPVLPQYLFARGNNSMFVSTNFGSNFTSISTPSFKSIIISQNTIFGLDSNKVYWTTDPLGSWNFNTNTIKANCIEASKENNNVLYAGTDLGLYKSTNKGFSWSVYNNSFDSSFKVIYLLKQPSSGDTVICATNKHLYKVFAPHIIDTNLIPTQPPELVNPPDSTIGIPGSVKLIWRKAPSATRYNLIVRKDNANGNIIKDVIVYDTSYFVMNLSPLTFYYWQVRSMNNLGNSSFSQFRKFKTSGKPYEVNQISPLNNALLNLPTVFICSKAKYYTLDKILDSNFIYTFHFVKDTFLFTGEITREINDTILTLDSLSLNTKYYWHVRASNLFGTSPFTSWRSFTILPIGIQKISENIPKDYNLKNNYPNPFNPVTKFQFDIPLSNKVSLIIYNSLGQIVETLLNAIVEPGEYEVFWDGSNYTSGVYFYKLTAGNFIESRKMILIK